MHIIKHNIIIATEIYEKKAIMIKLHLNKKQNNLIKISNNYVEDTFKMNL